MVEEKIAREVYCSQALEEVQDVWQGAAQAGLGRVQAEEEIGPRIH